MSTSSAPTLCLGDPRIDLVSERPGAALTGVDHFSRHLGGSAAIVALVAARAGARVALAGGAGDDQWGHWLRDGLEAARVGTAELVLLPEVETPLAFVLVDAAAEPSYEWRGEISVEVSAALEPRLDAAVQAAAALFITTDTLVAPAQRELTMRALELMRADQRPVIFDANLRLADWASRTDALASANACVRGSLLVRASREEAELMTGEADPERAALALVKAGAKLVVLTLGEHGAILRGALRASVPGVACRPVNAAGTAEVLSGTLLARLAMSGFYASSVAAALPEAIEAAARASERWGAVD